MKFRSRTEIIARIPNKFDAVIAVSKRVKMLVEGKKRLVEEHEDKDNYVKIAMEEIASGALEIEVKK